MTITITVIMITMTINTPRQLCLRWIMKSNLFHASRLAPRQPLSQLIHYTYNNNVHYYDHYYDHYYYHHVPGQTIHYFIQPFIYQIPNTLFFLLTEPPIIRTKLHHTLLSHSPSNGTNFDHTPFIRILGATGVDVEEWKDNRKREVVSGERRKRWRREERRHIEGKWSEERWGVWGNV